MAASQSDIEEFLSGPLVAWLATCVKNPKALGVYETFFDGGPIGEVLLLIDPEPTQPIPTSISSVQGLGITAARIKIFHCIIKNIKSLYEDELGQVIVALPDCVVLGRTPASRTALEQLQLLLLLLLGCAVQGPTKEYFINLIKELPLDIQHDIMQCIKRVTDDQNVVLTLDWADQNAQRLYSHVRSLISERDNLLQQWVTDLSQDASTATRVAVAGVESNHMAVELADMKARLRKQRQELEEKSEILVECREELEYTNGLVTKLKTENADLLAEVRKAKLYRDEADAMREKAERADKLENEIQRYRERLADADFYRVRVDELREDNRVLLETREMLEDQLARARQRADHVLQLEGELLTCKQKINDVNLEHESAKEKIQELAEENIQLRQFSKSALQEKSAPQEADSDTEEGNSGDNSLSEQLTNNAHARALKLELENKKLLSTIDSLRENDFRETSAKILELEKEKKRLALKCNQLQDGNDRLTQQNAELESIFKNALLENRKLQDGLDRGKVIFDRQTQELQNERMKIQELEKNIDVLSKEKQRIHALSDSVRTRADDAEKALTQALDEKTTLQGEAENGRKFEELFNVQLDKIAALEKEHGGMQKEITKLREVIEAKDVSLDRYVVNCDKHSKELSRVQNDNKNLGVQLEKLQEFEQKTQELASQVTVNAETIATLQKDLISEKVINEKFKTSLERLGLSLDILDNDINVVLEKMLSNPDLVTSITSLLRLDEPVDEKPCEKCSRLSEEDMTDVYKQTELVVSSISAEWNLQCEKLTAEVAGLQQQNEALQTENARMQVDVATLTSQVNSLSSQQTAYQLANSQLVAEKEEIAKQQVQLKTEHDTLLRDQTTLRSLHEQLYSEYDELKQEQDQFKRTIRDLRTEIRTQKETNVGLDKKVVALELEKDALKNESKSLSNLRAEHSKLKDDFRNLFTSNACLRNEYLDLQKEYKKLHAESGKLKLGNTEMQGELSTRSDLVAGQQLEIEKLEQKCDMLLNMNHSLDTDRRALMNSVSQILSQYHSLLMYSLQDKQQFHLEEKQFTNDLNDLRRQKEKLEEKIMEHYRKLDNASTKKKSFGSTLVRRMRKAGSDIISKVPSRHRRSWHDDGRLTQSQVNLGVGSGIESGGNDSDNSTEDAAALARNDQPFKRSASSLYGSGHRPRDELGIRRSSHRDLNAHHRNSIAGDQVYPQQREQSTSLSLGSIGSRKTVYLSDDDPGTVKNVGAAPPMLVYNRISTHIGGEARTNASSNAGSQHQNSATNNDSVPPATAADRKKSGENTKDKAVWYEYGCV